jgi:hypothetical protein
MKKKPKLPAKKIIRTRVKKRAPSGRRRARMSFEQAMEEVFEEDKEILAALAKI